jgi:uncharacterized protein (DUF924 family)
MRDVAKEIYRFWFEETKPAQWFQKNQDFDTEIKNRFEGDYALGAKGVYDGWINDQKDCLSYIILLDQMPRNMYRGKRDMYATDGKALAAARHAVDKGYDMMMTTDEKAFTYLPFEHSEDLEDQRTAVSLFEKTKVDNPIYYDFAVKHLEVIKRFGRFPHRNEVLGRASTKEEKEYLSQPNSGF